MGEIYSEMLRHLRAMTVCPDKASPDMGRSVGGHVNYVTELGTPPHLIRRGVVPLLFSTP